MRRRLIILGMIVAAVPAAFSLGEPELPGQSDSLPSDIEPPLLLQNLTSDDSTLDPRSTSAIENDLAQARKRAASADRLFRSGIIAKVEAEQRALRVVQLEAMLAEARLEEARKVRRKRANPKARSPTSRKQRGSRWSGVMAPRSRRPCATCNGRKSSSPLVAAANPTSIAQKRSSRSYSVLRTRARSPLPCYPKWSKLPLKMRSQN